MTWDQCHCIRIILVLQVFGYSCLTYSNDDVNLTTIAMETLPHSQNCSNLDYFLNLVRSRRNASFRFKTSQSQLPLTRGKINQQMEQTRNQLRHNLQKLKRRPRWTFPQSRTENSEDGHDDENRRNARTAESVVIENLNRWKFSTEQRMERLERLLESSSGAATRQSESPDRRNLIRQQEAIEANARRIEAMKINIAELQESVSSLTDPTVRHQAVRPDFETALSSSASVVRQQNDISTNARQITSLETSLRSLTLQVNSIPPSDYITSTLQRHEKRLEEHDVILEKKKIDVTSLQHQLIRMLRKGAARDAAISTLRRVVSNTSTGQGQLLPGRTDSRNLTEMQERVVNTAKKLDDLEEHVNSTCVFRIDALLHRVDLAEDKVNEARIRTDESVAAVRLQKRSLDEMTNRMEAQRVLVRRMQNTLRNQLRSTSRMNENLLDMVRHRMESFQVNISDWLEKQTEMTFRRLKSQVSGIKSQVVDNKNEIRGARNFLGVQIRRLSTNHNYLAAHIRSALPRFLSDVTKNNTLISERLASTDQRLATMTSQLERIEDERSNHERALQARINRNKNSINDLRSTYFDFEQHAREEMLTKNGMLQEAIIYLNITLHRMRAAAQRQTNRGATMTSQLERLGLEGRRTSKKFTLLREQVQGHMTHVANVTVSLRQVISSGISSFRQEVTQLLDQGRTEVTSMNHTLNRAVATQRLMENSLSGFKSIKDVELQSIKDVTQAVQHETRDLQNRFAVLYETTTHKISSLNQSLPKMVDHQTKRLVQLVHSLKDEMVDIGLKSREFERNSTKTSEQFSSFRRYLFRLNRNLHSVRHASDRLSYRSRNLDKKFRSANKSIDSIQKRLSFHMLDWQRHDDVIKSMMYEITSANKKIVEETTGFYRFHNTTRQSIENLRLRVNGTAKKSSLEMLEVNKRVERLTSQLLRITNDLTQEDKTQTSRITRLETLNGTLRRMIRQCRDEINTVEDSVDNLRQTDVTLFESITLHERALVEHRKLHRNLTVLSDGVHSMINEHAEALDTVRHVVIQLNETVEEGKEQIEETVATQVQRHLREMKNLRSVMHNFTHLLQTVLTDKLNQEISVASVKLRQRSILESLDSHSASIDRMKYDVTNMHGAIDDVRQTADSNRRHLATTVQALTSHQRQLQNLDAITFRLTDFTSQLNTSLMTQSDEILELDRFLETNRDLIYDVAELLSNQREDSSKHWNGIEEMINSILAQFAEFNLESDKQNQTLAQLHHWSIDVRSQMEEFDANIEFLDTRVSLIAGALELLAFVETNITDLRWSMEETQLVTQQNIETNTILQKSVLNLDAAISEMKSEASSLEETNQEHYERTMGRIDVLETTMSGWLVENEELRTKLSGFKTQVLPLLNSTRALSIDLNETIAQHQLVVLSILELTASDRQTLQRAIDKLHQHDLSLKSLRSEDRKFAQELEKFRTRVQLQTTAIGVMVDSANEIEETTRSMQEVVWSAFSRLSDLTSRADDVEDEVSALQAKLSHSSFAAQTLTRNLAHKIQILESNVTDLYDVIGYLEYDVGNAYNFTQRLFESIQDQESRIEQLNQSLAYDAIDVFTSIVSSIASVEDSIEQVNDTLSADVTGISSLLIDFQLAFDTSGRLMERQHHELNILVANSSHYFAFFSTAIEYLKQIAHQTTDAIDENRNRVEYLNTVVNLLQREAEVNSSIQLFHDDQSQGVFPAGLINGNDGEYPSDYDNYYNDDYDDELPNDFANSRSQSPNDPSRHPASLSYDISAILSGEADQLRIERKLASILDNSYVEYDEDDVEYT